MVFRSMCVGVWRLANYHKVVISKMVRICQNLGVGWGGAEDQNKKQNKNITKHKTAIKFHYTWSSFWDADQNIRNIDFSLPLALTLNPEPLHSSNHTEIFSFLKTTLINLYAILPKYASNFWGNVWYLCKLGIVVTFPSDSQTYILHILFLILFFSMLPWEQVWTRMWR